MITVNKETLIGLIQSFIKQGADDQINFGQTLSPKEYNESIELQLKQIEIILHDDLKQDCNCDMCDYYANSNDYANSLAEIPLEDYYNSLDNAVDKQIEESQDVKKLQSYPGYLANL